MIQRSLASGRYGSEEELLVAALQSLADFDEELATIEEGVASVDRGDEGVPLDQAFERLHQRYSIPESL